MTFEEALRYELQTIQGLTNKVFPLFSKEGTTPPFVIYVSSEGVSDRTLDGFQLSKEIDCELYIVETSYTKLKNLTKSINDLVKSFQGRVIGTDLFCYEVIIEMPSEEYNKDVNLYRSLITFNVRI